MPVGHTFSRVMVAQNMPLYEFTCSNCHQNVELLVRSGQEDLECPECGSRKLEKQLSVAAAPAVSGTMKLPVSSAATDATCGRPQCGSGCMFS